MNTINYNTILVMIPNNIDYETITNIKQLLYDKYDYTDIGILNDFSYLIENHEISVLPTYYLRFHNGPVVFVSLDDYLENRMNIVSNNVFLYLESLPENIDRSLISSAKIIAKTPDGLKVISNEIPRTV